MLGLRLRETQIAGYGSLDVPPHIVLDKQEAERELRQAQAELRRLRLGPTGENAPYLGLLTFREQDTDRFFGRVVSVAFSSDGTTLASTSDDQTIRLWDVKTHQPLGEPLNCICPRRMHWGAAWADTQVCSYALHIGRSKPRCKNHESKTENRP